MKTSHMGIKTLLAAALTLSAALTIAPTPGWAIDVELAGVRVGSLPTAVTQRLGSPRAILARRSDGSVSYMAMDYQLQQTTAAGAEMVAPRPTTEYSGPGVVQTGQTAGLNLP